MLAGRSHVPEGRAEYPLRADMAGAASGAAARRIPPARVRKRVLCEMPGGEGYSQPPIASPREPALPPRNTPEGTQLKVEMSLKMALFVEVCLNPAPWLRRKRDCGNFLAQFLLG